MIEGSGSKAWYGSIPLTSGSGSTRPKNTWIRNTDTGSSYPGSACTWAACILERWVRGPPDRRGSSAHPPRGRSGRRTRTDTPRPPRSSCTAPPTHAAEHAALWIPVPGHQGCGSLMFIPDPDFLHPWSEFFPCRIPDLNFFSSLIPDPNFSIPDPYFFYPGSEFFPCRIPDPIFFHPGSRIRIFSIPDPGSASKNLIILTQKIVSKLSEIWSGLLIPDPDFLLILNDGVKKAVKKAPDPGSATLPSPFRSGIQIRTQTGTYPWTSYCKKILIIVHI